MLALLILGDIQPPESVVKAMHSQVSAERQKRALILESEGSRQSSINVAEGQKQSAILASEGDRQEKINRAQGDAEALLARARASAVAIETIGKVIRQTGEEAVQLMVAEKYLEAFGRLAKEGTTILLPSSVNDPAGVITQVGGWLGGCVFRRWQYTRLSTLWLARLCTNKPSSCMHHG